MTYFSFLTLLNVTPFLPDFDLYGFLSAAFLEGSSLDSSFVAFTVFELPSINAPFDHTFCTAF